MELPLNCRLKRKSVSAVKSIWRVSVKVTHGLKQFRLKGTKCRCGYLYHPYKETVMLPRICPNCGKCLKRVASVADLDRSLEKVVRVA